jgi:hypothetical protein
MRKRDKLQKMVGATICFNVATPFSAVGELTQHVVLKVESVYKAKNGFHYVKGIALKRIQSSSIPEYRQYQVDRIVNGTLAIVNENEWTKKEISLIRLESGRARKIDVPTPLGIDSQKLLKNLKRMKLSRELCLPSGPSL